jgi:hypothetical protein
MAMSSVTQCRTEPTQRLPHLSLFHSIAVIVCAAVFLWPCLFLPGGTPTWHNGDQNLFLLNASRMLRGQLIYRDFFHFLLPGTETVFVTIFKVFGERAWIPNAVLIVLGVLQTWLIVSISSTVLQGWKIVLPGLLFLTCPYRNVLDATHHWFSSTVVLSTLLVIIERRTMPRLAIAGVLCGITAFFTSARGLVCVLGLVVFLFWEQRNDVDNFSVLRRKLGSLLSAFVVTLALICARFAAKAGFRTFWESVVVFPHRYYPSGRANTLRAYMMDWPGFTPWTHLPSLAAWCLIYALVPWTYVCFLVRYLREGRQESAEAWDRLMLLNIVGCALFCGVLMAPAFTRLGSVSAPALILFVWLLGSPGTYHKLAMNVLWVGTIGLAMVEPWPTWFHHSFVLDLPAGRVGFGGQEGTNEYAWLARRTRPLEYVFDSAARVYFLLHLQNPSRIPSIVNTGYTTAQQVQDVLYSLEAKQARFVLWGKYLDVPQDRLDTGDNLDPLRVYLRRYYHIAYSFFWGDILERNGSSFGTETKESLNNRDGPRSEER